MADLYNYVVLADGDFDAIQAAVIAELTTKRRWRAVAANTPGARHVQLWRARQGFLVVELDTSWDEGDGDLARALAKSCGTFAASCYYTGGGDWEALSLFSQGRIVASSSMNDAAGLWEIHKGKKQVYSRDWSEEEDAEDAEWEKATQEFEKVKQETFGSGSLPELLAEQRWHSLVPQESADPVQLSFVDPDAPATLASVQEALGRTVLPLLRHVGFVPGKGEPWRDDLAIAYEKAVSTKKLRVQYEFGKERIWGIIQRFEFLEWDSESKCWVGPHVAIGDREIRQFQPHQSPGHLARACLFLAANLARDWQEVSKIAPPVADELRQAAESAEWKEAAGRYDELWRTRLVAGERDPGWTSATQVFRGAGTILVETEAKERFTFKFDTSLAPEKGDLAVGGIWETSVGAARARKLKVGDKVFTFDEEGAFLSSDDDERADETAPESKKPWWKIW